MSRSTLTLASSLLLAFTPSISPADAVLDAEQILSLSCLLTCPTNRKTRLSYRQAYCLRQTPTFRRMTRWGTPCNYGKSYLNNIYQSPAC